MADVKPEAASPRAWLPSILTTAVLLAFDRARALGPGLLSLVDYHASNIGDPWPTVLAAGSLLQQPRPPLYGSFSVEGASFIYPPVAALLMLPFAGMPYDEAHIALSIVSRIAYSASVALAFAILRPAGRAWAVFGAAILALGFYPLLRAVQLNQSTLLVAVCMGGAVLALSRGRDALAGVLVGITAALKPQMAIVVLLMLWHSRRFVAAGLIAIAASATLSIACAGVADQVDYLGRVLPRLSVGYAFYPNQSWTGAILRLAGEPFADFVLPSPSAAVRVLAMTLNAATVVTAAWVLRTTGRGSATLSPHGRTIALGFAWLAVTLASPISWEHHYTPCLFFYALVAVNWGLWPRRARLAVALSFPCISGYVEVRAWTGLLGRLASSYCLAGALLLAVAFALAMLDRRSTT